MNRQAARAGRRDAQRGAGDINAHAEPAVFLSEILKRPKNEMSYLLVPAGYPAGGAKVLNVTKKHLGEIMCVVE